MSKEKIVIALSDYNREQLEKDEVHELTVGNCSARALLNVIRQYEKAGCVVKFNTSLWRRLFCIAKYQVVAYPTIKAQANDSGQSAAAGPQKEYRHVRNGTISTNGVSRPMTEAEMDKFDKIMDEKMKELNGFFDGMDKFFDEVEKIK